MEYMVAGYVISSVAIIGYVLLHSLRRKKLQKEIDFLNQLD
ncbi:CcmD family protein [Bacillus marasmi]|nr:CcmD family protein [Bacillus marasmi]